MKRHLRWIIPTLCVPLCYLGFLSAASVVGAAGDDLGSAVGALALLFAALGAPLAAAVVAIVQATKIFRAWRYRTGHLTRAQQAGKQRQASFAASWEYARGLHQQLTAGRLPQPIQVWGLVPYPGETMYFDLDADHSRYYGQDVGYTRSGGFFFGNPAFVIAGLAVTGIANGVRRSAAISQAREQWREHRPCQVIVTSHRLAVLLDGRWLSFDYAAMTAVYPEVGGWSLICQFGDRAAPLMLGGRNAPTIAVMTIMHTHGAVALSQHPSLTALTEIPASGVVS